MRTKLNENYGFTLIELMVTLAIFGVLSTMMYGTFNLVGKQVGNIGTQSSLSEKGQRILSYMEEDIRMIAYLIGPDASIPYCVGEADGLGGTGILPATSPVITYTAGTPYDSLAFITSVPVTLNESCTTFDKQEDCDSGSNVGANKSRIDYFLTSQCESVSGTNQAYVDAGSSCFDDIAWGGSSVKNGRSLITFDTLLLSQSAVAGSNAQVYYPLSGAPGTALNFSSSLQQNIPDNSTVYNVRMYRYMVDTTADTTAGHTGNMRNLKRIGWDKACATGADVTTNLLETTNITNTAGGVDGLKFEFTYLDTINGRLATCPTLDPTSATCADLASNAGGPLPITQLKAIKVWLLLRADKVDSSYNNKETYILGNIAEKTTLGPYNDNYRRLLLNKIVEVKNLARIY